MHGYSESLGSAAWSRDADVILELAREVDAAETTPYGRHRDARVAARLAADNRGLFATGSPGAVALSDRKRTTPQIFRPGVGRRTHSANTIPTSDGQDGRLSAQCDSQPEESPAP